MKTLLTGIKPTGEHIHLGNYFGALKPMIDLANSGDYKVYVFVANLHALTQFHDSDAIRQNTLNLVKAYIACGLDVTKVHIYNQSDIAAHTQLHRALSCITNMGFMKRMHAYKAAVDQGKSDDISLGTFNYPILMAADIILYDPDVVPVGKDQKQHVEYARDIAGKFNHMFGETFKLPEPLINQAVATVPGTDGRKMSKSYNNYIGIFDDEKTILKKVKRIPTAAVPVEATKDPDECNVYKIFKLFLDEEEDIALRKRYTDGGLGFGQVKQELAACITAYLQPIQAIYTGISDEEVLEVLAKGYEYMAPIAQAKVQDVYKKLGFSLS